jgi:hypothetical protein
MHLVRVPRDRISDGPPRGRGFVLAICLWISAGAIALASAGGQEDVTDQARRITFDIPAQPLASALDAYSSATGLEVLYASGLAAHHRSPDVKGIYTTEDALSILLEASGLRARAISAGAITIVATEQPAAIPGLRPGESPYRDYFAVIQASFERAFCHNTDTGSGDYRTVVRFKIGPSGDIQQPELLGSTGNPHRDLAIAAMLGHMTIGEPPPADLPQPVMMLVTPQSSGKALNCS